MPNKMIMLGLKGLGALGALGGAGYVGNRIGVRSGAEKMGDAMTIAFNEQNAVENANIRHSMANKFNAFNNDENQIIAQNAYQAGQQSILDQIVASPLPETEKTSALAQKLLSGAVKKGFNLGGAMKSGWLGLKNYAGSKHLLGGKAILGGGAALAAGGYGVGQRDKKRVVTVKHVSKY